MTRPSLPEERHQRAQLDTAKDMWGYFERLAAEKGRALDAEKKHVARLKKESKALLAELTVVREDRDQLLAYIDTLELRLKRVLASRTWRVMEPVRMVGRGIRAIVLQRKPIPEPLPQRPVLASLKITAGRK